MNSFLRKYSKTEVKYVNRLKTSFDEQMQDIKSGDVGVAVSGGGDSIAMLFMVYFWAHKEKRRFRVATVDHGLRKENTFEAETVKGLASSMGSMHDTLVWKDWDNKGNLQAKASEARSSLLATWAKKTALNTVLWGHTLNDQSETVLMRLGRGSGVDGLCGIYQKKLAMISYGIAQ